MKTLPPIIAAVIVAALAIPVTASADNGVEQVNAGVTITHPVSCYLTPRAAGLALYYASHGMGDALEQVEAKQAITLLPGNTVFVYSQAKLDMPGPAEWVQQVRVLDGPGIDDICYLLADSEYKN